MPDPENTGRPRGERRPRKGPFASAPKNPEKLERALQALEDYRAKRAAAARTRDR